MHLGAFTGTHGSVDTEHWNTSGGDGDQPREEALHKRLGFRGNVGTDGNGAILHTLKNTVRELLAWMI